MSENEYKRLEWLDACKGFATILVVLGHVLWGYYSAGLYIAYNYIMIPIHEFIYSFHMGLFFAISGAAFYMAYGIQRKGREKKFKVQLLNLIIIYFIFSSFQWIIKMLFSNYVNEKLTIKDLLLMPISPMSPYWYLWDLIVFYLIFYFIESKANDRMIFSISIIISIIGSFISSNTNNIRSCTFYCFLFWMGAYLAKTKYKLLINKWLIICSVITCSLTVYMIVMHEIDIKNIPIISLVVLIGITYMFFSVFYNIRKYALKGLVNVGRYSLEVYVLHCFITAANRKMLLGLGIKNFYFNVLLNTIVSIVIPIIFAFLCKKMNIHKPIFRTATWWYERNMVYKKESA